MHLCKSLMFIKYKNICKIDPIWVNNSNFLKILVFLLLSSCQIRRKEILKLFVKVKQIKGWNCLDQKLYLYLDSSGIGDTRKSLEWWKCVVRLNVLWNELRKDSFLTWITKRTFNMQDGQSKICKVLKNLL